MAWTPEGVVKRAIKSVLDQRGERLYKFMPVQSGYGKRTLDYLICYRGIFVAIEAKAGEGIELASKQVDIANEILIANGIVAKIGSAESARILLPKVFDAIDRVLDKDDCIEAIYNSVVAARDSE